MALVVRYSRRFVGLVSLALVLATGSAWAGTVLSAGEATAQGSPFSFVMTGADIPTLGEWAAIALMLLMGAYAAWRLRKNGALVGAGLGLLLLLVSSGGLLAVGGLAGAHHDPATMLGAPQGHVRRVSVALTADAGQTITGLKVHYRKAGGAWTVMAGAAAPTQACPNCWAGTMNTTGFVVGDTVQYYFEALVGGASVFAYEDPDPCSGHGTWDAGTCTCSSGYHGDSCASSCSDGTQNGTEAGVDCGGPCPACDVACDEFHYGPDCAGEIACTLQNGTCEEGSCYGPTGTGQCTTCDLFHYGPACAGEIACTLQNGTCEEGSCYGPTGTGQCTTCDLFHYGPACAGEIVCSLLNGTCADGSCYGPTGTGQCTTCDLFHYGSACAGEIACTLQNGTCEDGSCYGPAGNGQCDACTGNWALPDCATCTADYTGADCTTCASGFFLPSGECVDTCPYMHLASGECVDNCCLNQVSDPCEPSPHPFIRGSACLAECPAGTCSTLTKFCVDAIDLDLGFDIECSQHGALDPSTCACVCDDGFYGQDCHHDQADMDHCNAHGTYDAGTGTCTCDQGLFECYSGAACENLVGCGNQ